MSRLDDIAAALDARVRDVEQLRASIAAARDLVEQVRAEFARLAARDKTSMAADVEQRLDEAAGRLAAVVQRLHQARRQVNVAKGEGGGGSAPGVGGAAGTRPRFRPMRTDRAKADEIQPYVGLDYAVATLWDADGNRVLGPHSAGDDGPAATAARRRPWSEYPRLRRHVEAHAAARLKPGDTLVMYLNMQPCTYDDGCEVNLRDIIPQDAMLIVHWVKPGGTVDVLRYPGTGRGVRDE